MASLTLRLVKGSPLTNAEFDANFSNLNTDVLSRLLASSNLADLTNAGTARTNLGLGSVENKSSATIRSEISSLNVTSALGFTPYNATNPTGYITSAALASYLTSATAASTYQPVDGDLAAIAALAGTSGLLKKTAANTWVLDTAAYLTGITSGQVTTALGFTPYDAANPGGYITSSASITGNAATATKLATARAIAGVSFDGSADISISFSGISSKPTTLSGYGITDAQALDADLTAIAALAGASGLLKKTAANTWALDTSVYLTSITSGQVTTALGFTPYNSTNPSGYITSSALSPYLTSASASSAYQTILVSGTSIKTVNGTSVLGAGNIQIDGGVTSFNTRTGAVSLSSGDVTTALGYTPVNPTAVGSTIQGYDADLAAIAALAGTSGLLKKTSADTWALDTSTYLTGITSSQVTTALGFTPLSNATSYLPLAGGTVFGSLTVTGAVTLRSGGDNAVTLGGLNDITLGGTGHSGIITVGRSTLSEGIDVGAAAHGAFRTKTINIGTGGLASSVTTISIGSSVSGAASTIAANGVWTFANAIVGGISGNAATATALQTARTINGVSFNGSADITVADSTKLPLTGGTLTGGLTVGGDLLLAANSGGSRVVGFSGGTNTTLVLQAGAATGSGANLELTSSAFAFLDATETRIRSLDGATQFLALTSTATNVVTGALQQQGNQVLHAGNYFNYAIPSSGSPVISGSLTVTSTDPLFILKDNNNSGTAAGQRGWVSYQDSTGVERAAVGYTSASWTDFNITNSKGKVMIQGSEALTINNYSTTVAAINGFNATGSWPISVTGSAGYASTAGLATSLAGGVARSVPYQTAAGTTAMTAAGGAGTYLRVNAFGTALEWVAEAAISAGSATSFTSTTLNSRFNSIGVGTAASATAGEIRATNNITGYYSSDIRFKENVREIAGALAIVNAIGGKYFDWTDAYIADHGGADGYFIQKEDFGVIAQDVLAVFPRAVRVRPDGSLAVDYEKLGALAFAAICEQQARIEHLEVALSKLIGD